MSGVAGLFTVMAAAAGLAQQEPAARFQAVGTGIRVQFRNLVVRTGNTKERKERHAPVKGQVVASP